MLSGEEIRYPITETITFRDIGENPANIWRFLYFSGYLNAHDPQWADYDSGLLTYALTIPNQEILVAYRQFVNRMYEAGNPQSGINGFLSVFLENKPLINLEEALQDLVMSLVSMYDLAKLPEAVFHAFVLGLLANLRTIYEIRSNPESGYGRADILMIPKTTQYPVGYVIEFKSIRSDENDERSTGKAHLQIQEKEYTISLLNAGVKPEFIQMFSVLLHGKRVVVRMSNRV